MQKDVNVYTGGNIRSIELKPVNDSSILFSATIVVEHDDITTTYEIPYVELNDNCSIGINKKKKECSTEKINSNQYRYFQCDAKLNINLSAIMLASKDNDYGTVTDDYSKLFHEYKDKEKLRKSNLTI